MVRGTWSFTNAWLGHATSPGACLGGCVFSTSVTLPVTYRGSLGSNEAFTPLIVDKVCSKPLISLLLLIMSAHW